MNISAFTGSDTILDISNRTFINRTYKSVSIDTNDNKYITKNIGFSLNNHYSNLSLDQHHHTHNQDGQPLFTIIFNDYETLKNTINMNIRLNMLSFSIHSQQDLLSGFSRWTPIYLKRINGAVIISKMVTTYLGRPYGTCSSYGHSSDNRFDAISSDHCLRKCYQYQCYRHLHCIPVFFRNFSSQYDLWLPNSDKCNSTETIRCETLSTENRFVELCSNKCPKDCLNVQYKHRLISNQLITLMTFQEYSIGFDQYKQIPIYWDSTVPDIYLVETPSLYFIELLIKFGGLLGLFHGIYLQQIFNWIYEKIKSRF